MRKLFIDSNSDESNEQGMVLLITVFIVALATMLVFEMVQVLNFNLRFTRGFSESIQGNYILKSTLNLGRLLIELPKTNGGKEDWLGEPWAFIKAAPTLPIENFNGTARLMITDEDGKIDINSILSSQEIRGMPQNEQQQQTQGGAQAQLSDFWKKALRELFSAAGFQSEKFDSKDFKTPGDTTFPPADQVGVIADWIDADKKSFSPANFEGVGTESSADPTWFYNRPLRTMSELLSIPGMTAERVSRIAPYVRVSPLQLGIRRQVNINTAPLEVLIAMGFPESTAVEIVKQRERAAITSENLSLLVEGLTELRPHVNVTSREFGIFVQVKMQNITKWLFAIVSIRSSFNQRSTNLELIEIY